MTDSLTAQNIAIVRDQIAKKLRPEPFYASTAAAGGVLTDMDHFPYRRFFRGETALSSPVFMERQAGWRPVRNQCYQQFVEQRVCPVEYCWQQPCTTVRPCTPKGVDRNQEFTSQP